MSDKPEYIICYDSRGNEVRVLFPLTDWHKDQDDDQPIS